MNMLTWANSLIPKSITGSNIFNDKIKTKDLKFVFTNILVSFLRSFSRYTKNYVYVLFTMLVKIVTMVNIKTLKHCKKLAQYQQ